MDLMAKTELEATIDTHAQGEWTIKVECRLDTHSATGTVVVRQKAMPDRVKSPYIALAASRAWLVLGQARLTANDVQGTITCARDGLERLGSDYAAPLVKDDTKLKLRVAEERIQEGHLDDGAEIMLRMLSTRISLYRELHQETVLE
jgi:hypothetical protein